MTEAEGLIERLTERAQIYTAAGAMKKLGPVEIRNMAVTMTQAVTALRVSDAVMFRLSGEVAAALARAEAAESDWQAAEAQVQRLTASIEDERARAQAAESERDETISGCDRLMAAQNTIVHDLHGQLQRLTASLEDAGMFTLVGWRYRYNRMGDGQPWHFSPTDPGELQDGYVKEALYTKGSL